MSAFYNEIPGDLFQENMSQRADMLDKVQTELELASRPITMRMARAVAAGLNKAMAAYVDEVLAYRKMTFIDMISVKYQSMKYEEMQIGLMEDIEARITEQIDALSVPEWLVFQFRDAALYYTQGVNAVKVSIKADVLNEFGRILDEHFHTKRMQRFLERYPWLMK